ncbi:MAG TPA: cupin domain-containing protein [Candidatus Acidoferrales bacterium]|nr:cupin domain-containing protein [Candidatus Acidoferrales bacterium]
MLKAISSLAILLAFSPAAAPQDSVPPKQAIDIPLADIKAVQKTEPPAVDQQIRVVDMGKYNLAVGVIHRGPTRPGAPVTGISHDFTTETYVILSGSGTLVTGGTMIDPKPIPKESEPYRVLNGPSETGTVKDAYSRTVSPGDVIIIPANVFHGWTNITDHVDYLSVRPDPDKVLPAGYVHPAIKK